jgi:hypothetical protein
MKPSALIILLLVYNPGFGQAKILTGKKTYFYSAYYCDSAKNIFIQDTILFMTTDIPWRSQPDKQITVIWEYPNLVKDTQLRAKLRSIGWLKTDSTGGIENEVKLWIHPPRNNQYTMTEIAPFPVVEYPCELNKEYTGGLYIGSGWGDWENLHIRCKYHVVAKKIISIGSFKYPSWLIESESDSQLGRSRLNMAFNENIGFLNFYYTLYNNIRIIIDLFKIE